MAGLLSSRNIQTQNRGLLSGGPVNTGGANDAARRALEEQLAQQQAAQQEMAAKQAMMAQPQAAPQRERVSGWRLLDRVLGGQTISGGLDAERARLEQQAMRPQMEAQRQGILKGITDPRERALFQTSPEDWAKNVGEQFAPQVVASGAAQFIGGRRVGEQPTYTESGDQILRRDSNGVQPVYTRTEPSISERTAQDNAASARLTAEKPIELSPGTVALNRDGSQFGTGAERVFSVPDATQLYGERSGTITENQRDAPPVDPAAANSAQARATSALNAISNTRMAINRAREQTGFWTTGPLSGLPLNTPARDLNASLDTIKANLSFNELARMRAESPTGGALGSIAVRELDLLGSTVASLDQGQSKPELLRSMDVIDASLARWEAAVRQSQQQPVQSQGGGRPSQPSGPARIANDADYARLPSGATFVGPDGVTRRKP